jgi:hypothetical protein
MPGRCWRHLPAAHLHLCRQSDICRVAWLLGAAAVLVVILIVVIAAVPSGGGTSSVNDTAACQPVVQQLDRQLSGTSLGDITNELIASPKTAASSLLQYEYSFRQATQAASSVPQLRQDLNSVANDAGFASSDASSGFGNLGADITKLGRDVAVVDTTCGATPPFAQ